MVLELRKWNLFSRFNMFNRRGSSYEPVIKHVTINKIYNITSPEDSEDAVYYDGEVVPESDTTENQNPIQGSFDTTEITGTVAEDTSAGTADWGNESNATADDANYAVSPSAGTMADGDTTKRLKCTNFGFSIPTGATIRGIEVSAKLQTGGSTPFNPEEIRLVRNGSYVSENKADSQEIDGASPVTYSWGGNGELWGTTWDEDIIEASDFGCMIRFQNNTGGIDLLACFVVKIKVYYDT